MTRGIVLPGRMLGHEDAKSTSRGGEFVPCSQRSQVTASCRVSQGHQLHPRNPEIPVKHWVSALKALLGASPELSSRSQGGCRHLEPP